MKQRAEITFETEETIVLREGSRLLTLFCPATLVGCRGKGIFRLRKGGKISLPKGGVLICLKLINESKDKFSHEDHIPVIHNEIGGLCLTTTYACYSERFRLILILL